MLHSFYREYENSATSHLFEDSAKLKSLSLPRERLFEFSRVFEGRVER